ncbi:unnamed protein product, partial [Meganyctiphanes norvegica]
YTRIRGTQKSAIDMVLVNDGFYKYCKDMNIDEKQETLSFSDHNLISVTLRITTNNVENRFNGGKWIMVEANKKDKVSIKANGDRLENTWSSSKSRNVDKMIDIMSKVASEELKKKVKRNIGGEDNKQITCNWFTDEIRKEISIKRDIRRKERKCPQGQEKESLRVKREMQKIKIQKLVREAKEREERKIYKEIKNSDNKGKAIWKIINKIRGKKKVEEDDEIFCNGEKVELLEARRTFFGDWRGILTLSENKADEIWTENEKTNRIQGKVKVNKTIWIEEHLDMCRKVDYTIRNMESPVLGDSDIKDIIKDLKDNKSTGPDGIVMEVYKDLVNRDICREVLLECLNAVLTDDSVPENWTISRTKMIKKIKKPTTRDFRPIALTNVSYKILYDFYQT